MCFREGNDVMDAESEGHLDGGVFQESGDRFAEMRDALQTRTPVDRVFVKTWKKEAAQRAKEQQPSETTTSTPTLQLMPLDHTDSEELCELEENESLEEKNMNHPLQSSPSEGYRKAKRRKRPSSGHEDLT